jgi:glycosyltransferase involved in cell wall biosynthesis
MNNNHLNNSLVSVYIPTFNRVKLLKRAVESVIKQSYPNIELIIVDDNSTDDTVEYLEKIVEKKSWITYYSNTESKGACYSRNLAISAAKGKFITGLDDDDYFHTERIKSLISNWSDCYSCLATRYSLIGSSSRKSQLINFLSKFRVNQYYSHDELLMGNQISNQVFTLTSRLKQEPFDVKLPALQDFDLWYRICKKHGKAKVLRNQLQYIDIGINRPRITTFQNRMNALKIFQDKHSLTETDVFVLSIQFRLSTNHLIDTKSVIKLLVKGELLLSLKCVFFNINKLTALD